MNKLFRFSALVLTAALAFSGCAGKSSKSSSQDGILKIGVEGTFAPYNYHDESGKLVGFEVEIAQQIAQRLGLTPQFVETKWDSLIAGLDVQKYDIVINNINPTEERRQKYDFSEPYAVSRPQILVSKDSGINSIEVLNGKRCGQTPSSDFGILAAESGAQVLPTQGFSESAQLVRNGQAECTINDAVTISDYLKNSAAPDLVTVQIPQAKPVINAVMLAKNNAELKAKVNQAIEQGLADGSYQKIYLKYLNEDISPKKTELD